MEIAGLNEDTCPRSFDIQRKNVYVPESGIEFNVAGKMESKGIEIASAFNPSFQPW